MLGMMIEEHFWQELKRLKGEEIQGYELKRFAGDFSGYYTSDSCVEIVVVCSRRFQKCEGSQCSPWPVVFERPSHENSITFIPRQPPYKCDSDERAKRKASDAFLSLKHVEALKTHDKTVDGRGVYVSLANNSPQVVETPDDLMEKLEKKFKFDFDPCPVNPKQDAMNIEWGLMNFVNPPFKYVHGFLVKASEQALKGKTSVFLIPNPFKNNSFTGVLNKGVIRGITFLRRGFCFKGYKEPMPLQMVLMEIGPPSGKPIRISFWDPCPEKRRIKSVKSKCLL